MLQAMARGTGQWLGDGPRTGGSADPTVRRLEEKEVARLLGKEDALFLPSGVIGNRIALRILVADPGVAVAGDSTHVAVVEHGFSVRPVVTVPDPTGFTENRSCSRAPFSASRGAWRGSPRCTSTALACSAPRWRSTPPCASSPRRRRP
jgi:Beta-eliminating lyase